LPFLPDLIVRSRRVVTPQSTRAASVQIRGGKIVGVLPFDDVPPGCPLDDAGEAAVIPGIVDTNVHGSEPGPGGWQGFEHTTRAAAAGGVTTLIDMPMNRTTSGDAISAKRAAAEGQCYVDVGFWGAVTAGNERELAPMREAGVFGFACWLAASAPEECPPLSEADLRVAMPAIARLDLPLLVHAELPGPIDAALARPRVGDRVLGRFLPAARRARRHYRSYLESRPKAAENEAIGLMIALCREFRTSVHIVHLSSSDALSPLFHARSGHLPITAETCPHYLSFVAEEIADGATAFKCAPPIRERENREFLWAALAGGLIQMVVSDHSPAPPSAKGAPSADFARAWTGISSLQLSLPATWTEAAARGYTLSQVTDWMCRMPAHLASLTRKGAVEPGYEADLVVFDPDAQFTVEATMLQPGHSRTPYLGRRLRGVVERTYLGGQRIYERARVIASPRGRVLTRAH
jgi:allantoinase